MAEIKILTPENYTRWDEFVRNHPEGTFFHLTGWKKVIEKTFGHEAFYLYVEENNDFRGILPLFLLKSPMFGKFLVSNAFATYGGILAVDEIAAKGLLEAAKKLTQELKLDYLELRNLHRDEKLPTKDLYYTFRKKISSNEEDNFKMIPRKQRRMIRIAKDKYKLSSTFGRLELLDTMYEIYARSVHNLGSPVYPKKLFRFFLQEFPQQSDILVVSSPAGEPLAAVLNFYFRDEVLPYYGGSVQAGKRLAANDFMYWELMCKASREGYRIFDFGRSKKGTGSFSFKKHWGFEATPLRYQYYLYKAKEIPNLSPANPKFEIFIKTWKKMPFVLTKIVGPGIVKYLP